MKKIQIINLFPDMFTGVLNTSMLLKAQKIKAVEFRQIDLRQFGLGPRRQVDDSPYGGGDGMLLMIEPLYRAISDAKTYDKTTKIILTSPKGETFNQPLAERIANDQNGLTIICGHYEGVDERVMQYVDQTISIGDYVLTGGELPAMVMIDAITRLLPDVLGGEKSAEIESFADGSKNLEYPQYTRPEEFKGMKVPEVLLSGHHAKIQAWQQAKTTQKPN